MGSLTAADVSEDHGKAMKISVVVITKNEEDRIKQCLASVQWADEVIVVDARSEDQTIALAQHFNNVTVVVRDWPGYGKQKNFGIEQATGEWIFCLDADEVVSSELAGEIKNIVARSVDAVHTVPRRLVFQGRIMRWGDVQSDRQKRLFRKGTAWFDDAVIHENLQTQLPVVSLRNPLLHYSYRNLTDYFVRFNNYSLLDARRRVTRNQRFSLFQTARFPLGFFWRYIVRGGFLDGYPGFLWALVGSFYEFIKFAKLRELHSFPESYR
jgi:glycosyltransferase involved in cell wall biosynthesis